MQSKATSVAQYLNSLPPERREAIEAVRAAILRNLDKDYEEGMQYGMIGYYVPHRVYPAGYHCDPKQPLPFAGLASQKNHMSLYLGCIYGWEDEERWFRTAWTKAGKKLDMGKGCVRFRKLDDVPLDVVAELVRRIPARAYIERYERIRAQMGKPTASRTKANGNGSGSGANTGRGTRSRGTGASEGGSSGVGAGTRRAARGAGSGRGSGRGATGAGRTRKPRRAGGR